MSRSQPVIPVSAKMYRHFAVITVAITTCLAVFADGENREAIAQQLAEKKANHEMQQAERELAKNGKGGNNRLNFTDNRKVKGSFGTDAGFTGTNDSGVFDDGTGEDVQVAMVPEAYDDRPRRDSQRVTSKDSAAVPSSPPPGMTLEEFEELKKQARKRQAI